MLKRDTGRYCKKGWCRILTCFVNKTGSDERKNNKVIIENELYEIIKKIDTVEFIDKSTEKFIVDQSELYTIQDIVYEYM